MAKESKYFIVDERGRKKFVVLPIREYQELMEDLADMALIAERKKEPAEPLEAVKKRLEDKWRITESR